MRLAPLCGALLTLAAVGPAAAEPRWWVGGGGYAAVETGDLDATLGTEGGGFLGGGMHLVRLGPVLLGLEAEGGVGRVSADLSPDRDDVTVWRARLGARATWWRPGDAPRLVPYLRAGGVYRADRGDLIDDDGLGWYAGAGLDVRLGEHWSLGPFVIYEAVSLSVSTRTFLLGLGVTYSR
jgi:Outer membrane protein beta-barrel domain